MRMGQLVFGVLVFLFIVSSMLFGILGDWFWFISVGYESVFMKVLLTSVAIGVISFLVFFSVSLFSVMLARRAALGKGKKGRHVAPTRIMNTIAALASLFIAVGMANSWETVLMHLNATQFSMMDPVFGMDISFYAFNLPFYSLALGYLLTLFIFSAVIAAVTFVIHSSGFRIEMKEAESEEKINPFGFSGTGSMKVKWSGSWNRFIPLLSVMLFLIFLVIAAELWIARFGLLLAPGGAVFGAGYTKINVSMPLLAILSAITVLISILFLVNMRIRKMRFIVYGIAAFVIIAFIGFLAAGIVQGLVVQPNEFNLEKPFLERNIQSTLLAYGLDNAQAMMFSGNHTLTAADIKDNDATVSNIRLWDWRPLQQTYNQLQLFRTYYEFNDVDVDRYRLDGMYKQVLVSAREMNTRDLPGQAQTWVNEHLVYTHGYGAVMNPVDQVSSEGLPIFYMKDIPPTSGYIDVEQDRIYFGELTNDYVITGTSTEEFDYPSGDVNIYTSYGGTGGVPLSDSLRKLVYAAKFSSVELLVSGSLTPDSRLLMYRNIAERAPMIAPFLSYDPDPYLVTADGRLFWMIDAYTTTSTYPYSEPVQARSIGNRVLNYIRNSVKVVIDAYNGDVKFYVVDEEDPIIRTYQRIFPDLFRDFDLMPDGLKAHIRYPEGIFNIQAAVYSTYHMDDPMVFYNKEDVWVTPDEIYRGSRQPMQSYYIIMKLPGDENEEFVLMTPFTPKGKENLIGWMAARADTPNYGKLLIFQFSKQQLTYGPMQIEARIDQDPDISQLITLWSQAGSSVVRGNTLVIPIENSILYVEPLYLEATEKGTLPQLQRVIVAYGDRVTMKRTLAEALDDIFGTSAAPSPAGPGGIPSPPTTGTDAEKLVQIADLYGKAQQALADGDLGLYQQYVEQIGTLVGG
ncbi:MAG: UPF0182 family protein [Candidatus Aenigmarchaeota archaeon]|nr:UPF0182 family protein [Candidatus Aenigmarchaeota archaeon]